MRTTHHRQNQVLYKVNGRNLPYAQFGLKFPFAISSLTYSCCQIVIFTLTMELHTSSKGIK
jgi:hypothetical protein